MAVSPGAWYRILPVNLKFLTSAVSLAGCPADAIPEVALIGRSNAGKSSLINGIAMSRVAKTSSTPGKTRLLNFFSGKNYRLVDMPGYGFSSRSGNEQASWQAMIEPYLASRANLVGLLLVMDVRRDWSDDEVQLIRWLQPRGLPSAVALTKGDKLSRGAGLDRVRSIQTQSGLQDVMLTQALSTGKREGCDQLEDFFYSAWIEPRIQSLSGKKS